jgi:hypothetical protein
VLAFSLSPLVGTLESSLVATNTPTRAPSTRTPKPSQTPSPRPSNTSEPLEYISAVGEYGVLQFGPADGSIFYEGGSKAGMYKVEGTYKDFILEVGIRNPYSTSVGRWSYTISFRDLKGKGYFDLELGENRSWWLSHKLAGGIQSEGHSIFSLLLGDRDTNIITLLCRGDSGLFYVNGTFVSQLDLSAGNNSGYIEILFPAFTDQVVPGYYLHFEDLKVWTFPE